jgi:predicted TIM-barrel fold metal-dependent hydrolase
VAHAIKKVGDDSNSAAGGDVVISMDSHTHVYIDLKPYLPERFHPDFAAAVARSSPVLQRGVEFFKGETDEGVMHFDGSGLVEHGQFASGRELSFEELTVALTADERIAKIDEDGIAGEFITEFAGAVSLDPQFMHARFEAYCRWFEEYFALAPYRFTGSANVTLIGGMDVVVDEITFAYERGLRAIQLPGKVATMSTTLPLYNAPHYAPMWAALHDRGMAAVFHSGLGPEKPLLTYPGLAPGSEARAVLDRRAGMREGLAYFLLGGVLERHPNMRLGYIECGSQWIPPLLEEFDDIARRTPGSGEMLPSEQWSRQGFASGPLTAAEVDERSAVGVENLMWGSDFPHAEGTYPNTRPHLAHLFAAVSEPDRQAILSHNAARFLGFDLQQLASTPAAAG